MPGKENAGANRFGQQQNVARIEAKATEINYSVKTEPRYRQRTVYRLHVEQASSVQTLQLLSAAELESGIQQVAANCRSQEGS